jgi:RNA-binding protein YhbY
MSGAIKQVQLGKNGITENFIESLKNCFRNTQNVKIPVLKSAGHDKEQVKQYTEQILEALGKNYTAKIIGFTIVVKKWRRAKR